MKAHISFINYVLDNYPALGISVHCDVWEVENSRNLKDITDAIEAVDISELVVVNDNGTQFAWLRIIDEGTPEETVQDYTVTPLTMEWEQAYY